MLKKLAPILSILLITSNVFANQPAQTEPSMEDLKVANQQLEISNRKLTHQLTHARFLNNSFVLAGFTVCFTGLSKLSFKESHVAKKAKKVSAFTHAMNNKAGLSYAALASGTGLLAAACFAIATTMSPEPTAPTSKVATKIAADTDATNEQKSPLTA